MKIPNKGEVLQIAFNHVSHIGFEGSMNFHKNVLQNHFFLVIDTIFTLDIPLGFRKNLLERIH